KADAEKKARLEEMRRSQQVRAGGVPGAPGASIGTAPKPANSGSSFLDDWLAKRQQLGGSTPPVPQAIAAPPGPRPVSTGASRASTNPLAVPAPSAQPPAVPIGSVQPSVPGHLSLRGNSTVDDEHEVHIPLGK